MSRETELKTLKSRIYQSGRGSDGRLRATPDIRRDVLAAIAEHKLSIDDAAKSFGIATSTISKWKKRSKNSVDRKHFKKVAIESKLTHDESSSRLSLCTRDGFQINGLTLNEIVTLLREVSR